MREKYTFIKHLPHCSFPMMYWKTLQMHLTASTSALTRNKKKAVSEVSLQSHMTAIISPTLQWKMSFHSNVLGLNPTTWSRFFFQLRAKVKPLLSITVPTNRLNWLLKRRVRYYHRWITEDRLWFLWKAHNVLTYFCGTFQESRRQPFTIISHNPIYMLPMP